MSACRILPREEWHRLDQEAQDLFRSLNPEDVAVVVVEDGGAIVARLGVMRIPHLEGFWMAPEKAGNAGVTRALLRAAFAQAASWAKGWAYANATEDATMKTLERLGGTWIPMHTFMVPLRAGEET